MKPSRLMLLLATSCAASCGRVAELQPAPGHALPVKPLMARTTPTVKDLLALPPNARPDRVDELMKRSEPRPADPFDLPPPTGGSAPAPSASPEQQPASGATAPITSTEQ